MESELNLTRMDNNKTYHEQTVYGGGFFPVDLPTRPTPTPAAARRTRLRGFFTFSPRSYNFIRTPDGQARVRRIVMIVILVLRSAMSALSIISAVIKRNVAGIVIYSLLAILSLWFTATCLAIIGNAADNRNPGQVIKHRYFDVFLGTHGLGFGGSWNWDMARHSWSCIPGGMGATEQCSDPPVPYGFDTTLSPGIGAVGHQPEFTEGYDCSVSDERKK
ncbi:uncharacterized protein PV07_12598 [Cladophialophora immunda]|uniref:Uncharacterized protein n=1 Tax=Cladophialophora immunda TaxID=569365 RepID=A0A0D2BUD9_9EURO|nr:uncharacterized protein PV07_12598 [Cladophialophora immunda]KIW22000.1 hypothetical protein PV07_12598 [Cladophialophora immunda]